MKLRSLKRLVDSKDNITEEVAAEKQAYKVVTPKVDVGGIYSSAAS
jgi:hypothetical protein